MKTFGQIVFYLLMGILGIFLFGTALMQLWQWFIVPFGVRPLSFAHAYGLVLLPRLFLLDTVNEILKHVDPEAKAMPEWLKYTVKIGQAAILLLIGWVVSLFM